MDFTRRRPVELAERVSVKARAIAPMRYVPTLEVKESTT
ncbi:MAG: hypothetical protein A4E63_00728 [Syntrophorhabdus sp. PtaU1.Bin050]|nr:MAG: hypothetical protein A4E63_00728 [Syntrophorhabdus sp. PtaU1.Bin050]